MDEQRRGNQNMGENRKNVKKGENMGLTSIKNKSVRIKEKVMKIKNQMNQLNNFNHGGTNQLKKKQSGVDFKKSRQSNSNYDDVKWRESTKQALYSSNETAYFKGQQQAKLFKNDKIEQSLYDEFGNRYPQQNKYQNQQESYSPQGKAQKVYSEADMRVYMEPMGVGKDKNNDGNKIKNGYVENKYPSYEGSYYNEQKQKNDKNMHGGPTNAMSANFRNLKLSAIVLPNGKKLTESGRYRQNLLEMEGGNNSSGYIRRNDLVYLNRNSGVFSTKNSLNKNRNYRNQRDYSMIELPHRNQLLKKLSVPVGENLNSVQNGGGYRHQCPEKNVEIDKQNGVDTHMYDDDNEQEDENKVRNMSNSERNCSIGKIIKNMKLQEHYSKRMWKELKNMNHDKQLQEQQATQEQQQQMTEQENQVHEETSQQQAGNQPQKQVFEDIQIMKDIKNSKTQNGTKNIWSLHSEENRVTSSQPSPQQLQNQKVQNKQSVHQQPMNRIKITTSIDLANTDDKTAGNEIQTLDSIEEIHYFMVHQAHKLKAQIRVLENFSEGVDHEENVKKD